MRDHEATLIRREKEKLIKERKELEEELYRRMPLREKISAHFMAVLIIGAGIFYIWLIWYYVYNLFFKRPI